MPPRSTSNSNRVIAFDSCRRLDKACAEHLEGKFWCKPLSGIRQGRKTRSATSWSTVKWHRSGGLTLVAVMALACASASASDIPAPKLNSAAAGLLPEALKSRGEIHVVSTFGYAPQQYFGEDGKTPLGFSV